MPTEEIFQQFHAAWRPYGRCARCGAIVYQPRLFSSPSSGLSWHYSCNCYNFGSACVNVLAWPVPCTDRPGGRADGR